MLEKSLELSLHCSIVSIVNLFTNDQSTQFPGYFMQNPNCYLTCLYYPILDATISLYPSPYLDSLSVAPTT